MRCVAGCLVLLLPVIVAGCGRGERIARNPVESKKPILRERPIALSRRNLAGARVMGDGVKNGLGQVVGKPVAAVLANFVSTSSSSYSVGGDDPTGASFIGLHNRSRADTESQIQESFFDLLEVTLPAYHLPQACGDGALETRGG